MADKDVKADRMKLQRLFISAAVGALLVSGGVQAQSTPRFPIKPAAGQPVRAEDQAVPGVEWDKKRLERLERNVRKLEGALNRLKPDEAPPELTEPDPEFVALQARFEEMSGRVADLEATLKRVNGDLETSNMELERAKKAAADARAEADELRTRLANLESKVAAIEEARAKEAAALPQPSATGNSADDFKAAKGLILAGDFAGATKPLSDFLVNWPDSPEAPEAHYLLGETLYANNDSAGASVEYANALKGWPKTKWAPAAASKFALALDASGKSKQACVVAAEFDKRYAATAAADVKARVSALKQKAKCAAA